MEDIASDLLDTPTPVCLPHHYTPLPLSHFFHEWERLPGGIALDSPHNSVRLHTSVWPKPPLLRRGSADSSKQPLEGFCATSGTFLPPTKGSNRGSTSVGPETRLFQPLLSCTKEGRWSTTHSGPASSEPLPLQREVQDVDVEDCYVPDSSGKLVCHCRHEGCLFPHSDHPAAEEVPSVAFGGKAYQYKVLPFGLALARGCSQSAWMLLWPLRGSITFEYSTTWMIGSYWPTPGSK